jgi:secretion/DNA translocation related TadE-like protein
VNGPRRSVDHHPPCDRGIATVWAATAIAVLMTILMIALHLGTVVLARHRAEAAADLAALAAAAVAVQGADPACARAAEIATAMGGEVTTCGLAGWDALVEVGVPVPLALPGLGTATGRARAGPVPPPVVEAPAVDPLGAPGLGRPAP